ncbi:MAG: helix-turn-helix domain-containing protein [Limibacillus sp.]|jgi:DNA-binding XRE family transcriptional regulator/mannose-6-phosphate isomerase-like protein (cupin superfamily)
MSTPEAISRALAQNLVAIRKERAYTLDQLATLAKVSKGMLVQVEQGRTNPSINTLCRIANALNVSVPRLIEVKDEPEVMIVSISESAHLSKSERGSRATALMGYEGGSVVELWDSVIAPNDQFEGGPRITGAVEILIVLQGELTLELEGRSFSIPANSAVRFPGDYKHVCANRGEAELHFTRITIEPNKHALKA